MIIVNIVNSNLIEGGNIVLYMSCGALVVNARHTTSFRVIISVLPLIIIKYRIPLSDHLVRKIDSLSIRYCGMIEVVTVSLMLPLWDLLIL